MHRSGGEDRGGPESPESPADHSRRPRLADVAFIVLVVAPLLFFRLGSAPLANPDEGRYEAERAKDKLEAAGLETALVRVQR